MCAVHATLQPGSGAAADDRRYQFTGLTVSSLGWSTATDHTLPCDNVGACGPLRA